MLNVGVSAKRKNAQGCYSIIYPDLSDSDYQFAMDYNQCPHRKSEKGIWTCSESPKHFIHWITFAVIPRHGLPAILDHFGLEKKDFGTQWYDIYDMSPAELVRMRRDKETREGLEYKEIKNMRLGAMRDELQPESFSAAA